VVEGQFRIELRELRMCDPLVTALQVFGAAKQQINSNSVFAAEIRWQGNCNLRNFSETDFLREAAWVILCSGFRAAVIRKHFDFISLCFCDWESAASICTHADQCRETALSCFRNRRKIEAIIGTASYVVDIGFEQTRRCVLKDPIGTLQNLPSIGPVTAYHLAKNLGMRTAKPDRHLVHLALSLGFGSPHDLCSAIAESTGDPVQIVDLILWRYLEQRLWIKPPETDDSWGCSERTADA
jgi:hypothetical protein